MKKIIAVMFLLVGMLYFGAQKVEAKSYYKSSYSSYKSYAPSYSSYKTKGYYRSSGTYVPSHYRTKSDGYKWNNYSSRGNYNPYTGKKGYTKW